MISLRSLILPAFALALATPAAAQDATAKVLGDFLLAADANDTPAMRALLSPDLRWVDGEVIDPDIFLKRIANCYLRRVYGKDGDSEIIAAWMCDEGKDKSRVVLGSLGYTVEGTVLVAVTFEQGNDRPAPARTGSAFATPPPAENTR